MEKKHDILVKVENLVKWFPVKRWFFQKPLYVKAVDDVSFEIRRGETLGIVGESGCGKSTLLRTVLRLIEPTSGKIFYDGKEITNMRKGELRKMRKKMQIVFQDPYSALDGRMKVGAIIEEPMIISKLYKTKAERMARVAELMELVGLDPSYVSRFPHEFSGGQRQRIVIARALATDPELLVCDEAVSALDVSVRAQILNLLEDLQDKLGLTYLFISHDLSVVEHICDRVGVMYLGRMVEIGNKKQVFSSPQHPYTKALLSAIPIPGKRNRPDRIILQGDIPSPVNPPEGCRFRTRCAYATEACKVQPERVDFGSDHMAYCHLCKADVPVEAQ